MIDVTLHRRRLEKGLRRDTATVEAGAAKGVLLDEGDVQARRCSVQGGGIATRTATDHYEVEMVTHRQSP